MVIDPWPGVRSGGQCIRCAAIFHTRVLARTNYWADFLEILHGWLLDDSKWDSRGTFFYFQPRTPDMG